MWNAGAKEDKVSRGHANHQGGEELWERGWSHQETYKNPWKE